MSKTITMETVKRITKKNLKESLLSRGVEPKSMRFFESQITPEIKISINWKDYLKVKNFNEFNGYKLNFCF